MAKDKRKTEILLASCGTLAEVAANTSAEQEIAVSGVSVGDFVAVTKPTAQAGIGIVGARVSATDVVSVTFMNTTAAGVTPTGSEVYVFFVAKQ